MRSVESSTRRAPRSGRTRSELARDALRRQLALLRFERLRKRTLPLAEAQEYLTKVVFDTDVVLAAFATRGLCADLFAHVLLEHELLAGEIVIRELRSELRTKLKPSKNAIDEIEALLRDQTVITTPAEHLSLGISDPDDEWIVAEAKGGEADVLVTGDAALQKVVKRSPLPIVSPRGLWETLRGPEPGR